MLNLLINLQALGFLLLISYYNIMNIIKKIVKKYIFKYLKRVNPSQRRYSWIDFFFVL